MEPSCSVPDPRMVERWIEGWTLARLTPPPVPYGGGWRVDVGWPTQRARYVFPRMLPAIGDLASTITEPWIFLKACVAPAAMQAVLPSRWIIQRPGFMMTCAAAMPEARGLPAGYVLDARPGQAVAHVRVLAPDGATAASGQVVRVGEHAIYNMIETQPQHQRLGLARTVMKQLEKIAQAQGATRGLLVATPEGRALYETLGWELYSLYTTAVIPAAEA
ncbi:MAG: GNAT family N-acetyltransferase [Burkholderiaceae bacterium]|nr:GNAT family N-acetyltransferase [Burkholderiaceae bacterium]